MSEFLMKEANRCLLCRKARCSESCPVFTDIPRYMKMYKEGKFMEVGQELFYHNPMSVITSRVCDRERTCNGGCILNRKGNPVHWYEIEQEISSKYIYSHEACHKGKTSGNIAIIGAGPAGITAAIKLREQGFNVVLFDKKEKIGGVIRYGIPDFRLDKKHIAEYDKLIEKYSIVFKNNTEIGKDVDIETLADSYDAVLIATGSELPKEMGIPGEMSGNIIPAIKYLEHPEKYRLGREVIVIGGGNVAMDACRTAKKQGCNTFVYYRKSFENMPANKHEIEEAVKEGVKFNLFEAPVEIKNGKSVIMKKCRNVTGEDGKIMTEMIDGSEHEVFFDNLIVAIGENSDYSILGNVASDKDGKPATTEYMQTSHEKIFVAGDFITGPKTVANAVYSANKAVDGIVKFLKKEQSCIGD